MQLQLPVPIIIQHTRAVRFNLAKWISGPQTTCSGSSSNPPRRQQLSERTAQIIMYTKCLAGGINVWSICNKNSLKDSVFCQWNESRKRDPWRVSLGMISVYPCRNKLFKARDWKRGGRGGALEENDTKKKERERWREKQGRMKPTHLEERRQKESMTVRNNEIWKSAWLSPHLKRVLT